MARKKPNFFIDAFYESKFKDNLFVIKAGGKIIEDQKLLDNLLSNIRDLTLHGIKILLIYGHGRLVDEKLESRKIPVNKVEGRRVTDSATMEVIQEVVGGTLSRPRLTIDAQATLKRGLRNEVERRMKDLLGGLGR